MSYLNASKVQLTENTSLVLYSNKLAEHLGLQDHSSKNDFTLNILKNINESLKKSIQPSEEEYVALAGSKGSLRKVLEDIDVPYISKLEAAKCLHYLTFIEAEQLSRLKIPGKYKPPTEIITAIQKTAITILKQVVNPKLTHLQYSNLSIFCLSMLHNLIICASEEVLGSLIISASYPFAFYEIQEVNKSEFFIDKETSSFFSEPHEYVSDSLKTYTNRNRKKRLRRKKAQPSCFSVESPSSGISASSSQTFRRVVVPSRILSAPQDLNSVSLKPQQILGPANSNDNIAKCHVSQMQPIQPDIAVSGICDRMKDIFLEPSNVSFKNLDSNGISSTVTTNEPLKSSTNLDTKEAHMLSEYDKDIFTLKVEPEEVNLCENQSSVGSKVRQYALLTLNAVVNKCVSQNKFSFWPQMMCQTPSLMTCILNDPSVTVRMTALQVVNSFIKDSQKVLSMATEDSSSASYTTLGKQLGSSLRELHRCLILSLISEKSPSSLVRILKALELLVENVKYGNLKPGLLTKTVTHVKYFLRYKDPVVRANAFSFMVSLLMMRPQVPELKDLLTRYQLPVSPSLSCPPPIRPPSPCEEQSPGEHPDVEEQYEISMTNMDSASDYSFSSDSGSEMDRTPQKTMVSWLVQRCMDSLLLKKNEAIPGIYIQVQLQSLKVLCALVSEHLNVVKSSLPLIQHIITICCDLKFANDQQRTSCNSNPKNCDPASYLSEASSGDLGFVSPDPIVIVEHSFLLLSALLGSVKAQLERNQEQELDPEQWISSQLALQLWLWALQHPLKPLIDLSIRNSKTGSRKEHGHELRTLSGASLEICSTKIVVAAAKAFTNLCNGILQALSEPVLNEILNTVLFLLHNGEPQIQLSGIKIMAVIMAYPPVQEHTLGPKLVMATIQLTTLSLEQKLSNVNKDRLISSWALANVIAAMATSEDLPKDIGYEDVLTKATVITILRAAIIGCEDKDKIRPHAVRCLGNTIALLSSSLMCDPDIEKFVNKAVESLIGCCTTGSNMKMRWNACQSLGVILSNEAVTTDTSTWRISVLKSLSSLMECFGNYKVRIQACAALCCPKSRTVYGQEYHLVWRSLLQGFEDSQNILDYQKIQHRDDLSNQLCITLCHLVCHLELGDLESLPEILLFHRETIELLLKKAHDTISPERASCIIKSIEKIKGLQASDAITVAQGQSLVLLDDIFKVVG